MSRAAHGGPVGGTSVLLPLVAAFAVAGGAHAEPFIPASDATILERLPAADSTRQLATLRRAVDADPQDVRSALRLAQGYLEIGRRTSDPRFVSYAEATLAPWLERPSPPAAALVMQATALQSLHRFDESLALLERALRLVPRDAQALLTKATVLQVRGRFADARATCRQLLQASSQAVALTCVLTVDSLSGRLDISYSALRSFASTASGTPAIDAWIQGQLAEMSVRRADFAAAQREFAAALSSAPDDIYLRAAQADLLLLQGRNGEVVESLQRDTAHDALLLRLAIAARRADARDAIRWAEMFDARRRAVRADDNPHLREHARFVLDVLDRPQEALELARRNWQVQREPADLQIYARAARAANSATDETVVRRWLAESGCEDRTLPEVRS